jgi:nitroimidazol reductase NimA-like FMN-containing flavoprotein (pyridoxamine 5'-phosphate oxidase superfamily)
MRFDAWSSGKGSTFSGMTEQFPVTERTRMRRKAKRATYDRGAIYAILDEALIASVAIVVDGRPQVQPMIHCRMGDRIILHGLATNRLLNSVSEGAELCLNVCMLDALVIARRIEDHSMHYRSATIYGRGRPVSGEAHKQELMEQVFTSLVGSGRYETLPPLPPGYLAGTTVVVVDIEEAVAKVNAATDTADGPNGIWSGIIPVRLDFGAPVADERTAAEGLESSAELSSYTRG